MKTKWTVITLSMLLLATGNSCFPRSSLSRYSGEATPTHLSFSDGYGIYVNSIGMPLVWSRESLPIHIRINPGFISSEINLIEKAVTNWNNQLNDHLTNSYIPIFVFDSTPPDDTTTQENTIYISHSSQIFYFNGQQALKVYGIYFPSYEYSTYFEGRRTNQIPINIRYVQINLIRLNNVTLFEQVVVHELGHALGLDHDLDDVDSAMYPHPNLSRGIIRESDLQRLRFLYFPTSE